jgi:hypothetical protein
LFPLRLLSLSIFVGTQVVVSDHGDVNFAISVRRRWRWCLGCLCEQILSSADFADTTVTGITKTTNIQVDSRKVGTAYSDRG